MCWGDVALLLDKRTRMLPSVQTKFKNLFEDSFTFAVDLPRDKLVIQHAKRAIDSISKPTCFKIGMTIDPIHRFYTAWCSYSSSSTQARDGATWDKMTILYVHHSRDACLQMMTMMRMMMMVMINMVTMMMMRMVAMMTVIRMQFPIWNTRSSKSIASNHSSARTFVLN